MSLENQSNHNFLYKNLNPDWLSQLSEDGIVRLQIESQLLLPRRRFENKLGSAFHVWDDKEKLAQIIP